MTADEVSFVIRLLAALVWTGVLVRARTTLLPGTRVIGLTVIGVTTAVLWGSVLRGASIIGLASYDATLVAYTAITFAALVAGVALFMDDGK